MILNALIRGHFMHMPSYLTIKYDNANDENKNGKKNCLLIETL